VEREAVKAAHAFREECARIERLQRLADSLYGDPRLLLVDYFDRYPDREVSDEEVARIRRFSAQIKGFDEWWSPIMQAWVELAARTKSQARIDVSLDVLREVIMRLDSQLASGRIGASDLEKYFKLD